jgi:hypothetical protein
MVLWALVASPADKLHADDTPVLVLGGWNRQDQDRPRAAGGKPPEERRLLRQNSAHPPKIHVIMSNPCELAPELVIK